MDDKSSFLAVNPAKPLREALICDVHREGQKTEMYSGKFRLGWIPLSSCLA